MSTILNIYYQNFDKKKKALQVTMDSKKNV